MEAITANSAEKQILVERVGGLTDEVLESVDAGRQAAVEAVRKFAGPLEEATSEEGDPSRREALIEAAVNLADELSRRRSSYCTASRTARQTRFTASRTGQRTERPQPVN